MDPDLPQPVLLLHLAQLHLHQAHQLIPQLTIRPTEQHHLIGVLHYKPVTTTSNQLAWAASSYRKHITIAIACLRSILASSAQSISTELNLLTRCKLINILLSETKEYAQAFELVQHGLSLARQSDHLVPFKLKLSQFLIYIQASDPNVSFRQLKKQVERAIEITIKTNVVDQKYVSWYYRFQLLLSHIAYERAKDFPAALAALKNVMTLAEQRDDWELWIACKTQEIKIALDRCEWTLVSELFKLIIPMVEFHLESQTSLFDSENHPAFQKNGFQKIVVGQQLKTLIMLLLIIFYSVVGETQLAKGWVKHLRTELDRPNEEDGLAEGTCKIYLKSYSPQTHQRQMNQLSPSKKTTTNNNNNLNNSSNPLVEGNPENQPNSQYVLISILPKEVMYTLTYLVSLAIYFDGHGKSPKSLMYAEEGLKQIDRQLIKGFHTVGHHQKRSINFNPSPDHKAQPGNYSSCYYYPSMITSINSWLKTVLAIKLETNISLTQLAIVRSDFHRADQLLVEIIRRVSEAESWEIYNGRVSFLKSMLSHATGNQAFARQSLLTTLHLVRSQTKQVNQGERLSYAGELGTLAKASYYLVRMAESDANSGHPNRSKSLQDPSSHPLHNELPRSLALDHLVKELSFASQSSIPNINMAIQVVLAMSCGEIVKAKHHLTIALNEANKTSNTHIKMILLGLLSTMFLNTRSDQATAMLKSCFKLSLGFSSSSNQNTLPLVSDSDKVAAVESVGVNDIVVGNPSLGLWVGKKLVDIFESQESAAIKGEEEKSFQVKIQRMKLSNLAHQKFLDRIPLL